MSVVAECAEAALRDLIAENVSLAAKVARLVVDIEDLHADAGHAGCEAMQESADSLRDDARRDADLWRRAAHMLHEQAHAGTVFRICDQMPCLSVHGLISPEEWPTGPAPLQLWPVSA